MSTTRLLVVSPSCIEGVNRAVYRLLATHYHQDIHLVIPENIRVGAEVRQPSPVDHEPFPTSLLEFRGAHSRLQRCRGFAGLMEEYRPTHVLVESDPATALTREAVRFSSLSQAKVWVLTCENQERSYLRESWEWLRKGKLLFAMGGGVTWWFLVKTRPKIDQVFTISSDGTKAISNLGFAGRVTQIPLGFDPLLFYIQNPEKVAVTRKRLGLHSTTIAYFGRLVPEKGLDFLISVLSSLKEFSWQFLLDRFENYRTPYTDQVQAQLKSVGLENRVVYFDAGHSEIPDYMNAADVVVLPSYSTAKFKEQYGRVLAEAMACGKLVVGSTCGAIPELIGDGGLVFPERNERALNEILRKIMSSPTQEFDVLRSRAHQRAHDELSVSRQAEIFYRCLNSNQAGS